MRRFNSWKKKLKTTDGRLLIKTYSLTDPTKELENGNNKYELYSIFEGRTEKMIIHIYTYYKLIIIIIFE